MTAQTADAPHADRYQWIALANTTASVFMSVLDGSIVLIAMPAIFRGIHLDPLAPANFAYLLWMIMGYRLVQAVFVVTFGRLGDMYGRVRIYNCGFAIFTFASIMLSFDPYLHQPGAMWLIGWRTIQALGGAMLLANSAAIVTDAFPANRRGFALGMNQVAGQAGQLVGLVAGGLLASWDWRAIFWVNVPVGIFGTIWAYSKLRETSQRTGGRIDWLGNATFAVGLGAVLVAITVGLQPYRHSSMGWVNPVVLVLASTGFIFLGMFFFVESRTAEPLIRLQLFRIRPFAAGNIAIFAVQLAQGGLQIMLIIWLQGVWLPLHGYAYSVTPLWAGIYLLPLAIGFLVAGPIAGTLSDSFGTRGIATAGLALFGVSFFGLMLLPVNFSYDGFGLLILCNGIGTGMFSSPNISAMMSSVPPDQRGTASGIRSTVQNSGAALSIGVFFSLMVSGLARGLPAALTGGLEHRGIAPPLAHHLGALPPVSSLFAAMLGVNPLNALLAHGAGRSVSPTVLHNLTNRSFFPQLIAPSFHSGLIDVFSVAIGLALIAFVASFLRGSPNSVDVHSSRPARPFEQSSKSDEITVP